MNVDHLVSSLGYWAVFLLVAAESLGVPLPGETALIVAGAYAGQTHHLNPWIIFAVASAAAIAGDNVGFWIGDKGGYRLAKRYGSKVRLDERKLKIGRYVFDRHGGMVVFFGRFVSILRTYAAFLAGTNHMRYPRFLVFNASGGILWAALYSALAYNAAGFLDHASTPFEIGAGCLAAVALVVTFVVTRRHMGTLTAKAEVAYPGPLDHGDTGPGQLDGGPVA